MRSRVVPHLLLWVIFSYGMAETLPSEVLCISNACYTVHLGKHSFDEAQEKCKGNGGDLVTITSEEEAVRVNDLILKLLSGITASEPIKLWIGLRLKKCVVDHQLLRGFSWISDTGDSQFSNWMQEPKRTCTGNRCVVLNLNLNSSDNYKWSDIKCTLVTEGYICKFHFKGMCQRVVMAGPGRVEYIPPFDLPSTSLALVPHGSMASIFCEQKSQTVPILICKEQEDNTFGWSVPGPFCASAELGCKYNNGGCEQDCIEDLKSGSLNCSCKEGYVLASDLISCVLPQNCQPNSCEYNCINHPQNFECTCPAGFMLDENQVNCKDVNECLGHPCNQSCINTHGSFVCSCKEGFSSQGTQCLDKDECIHSPCAHGCLNTHGSYHCSCNEGFLKASDGFSCLDVDECNTSPCEVLCQNTPGSYTCSCLEGYILSSDGISCAPDHQQENKNLNNTITRGLKPKEDHTLNRGNAQYTTQSSIPLDSVSYPTKGEKPHVKLMPTIQMDPETDRSAGNGSMNHVKSGKLEEQKMVLLVSTVCACGLLVLLAVIAGILYQRKKNSDKVDDKPPSAADKYSWVPDQSENKAINNDHRL